MHLSFMSIKLGEKLVRKSEALAFRVLRLREAFSGICHGIQFNIVDRFLSRSDEMLSEKNSVINLLQVLEDEIKNEVKNVTSF